MPFKIILKNEILLVLFFTFSLFSVTAEAIPACPLVNEWYHYLNITFGPPYVESGEYVYIIDGGILTAYDTRGNVVWRYPVNSSDFFTIDKENQEILVEIKGGIVALDLVSGKIKWQLKLPYYLSRQPVLTKQGNILLVSLDEIHLVNKKRQWLWSFKNPNSTNNMQIRKFDLPTIADDGSIYVTTDYRETLYALSPDGKIKWKLGKDIKYPKFSHPIVDKEGNVYVVASPFGLMMIKPGGEIQWELAINVESNTLMRDSEGTIYASNYSTAFAISAEGQLKWKTKLPVYVSSSRPILAPHEKWVYYVTRGGGGGSEDDNMLVVLDKEGKTACMAHVSNGSATLTYLTFGSNNRFYTSNYWGQYVAGYYLEL